MENQIPRLSTEWEHSLTNLLGHGYTKEAGRTLRPWVHFQGVHSLLDLLSWDPAEIKADPTQTAYHQNDHGQVLHLRTNQVKQISGLITYMRHIFESYNSGPALPNDPFHLFTPDEWEQHTPTQMRTYLIQHLLNTLGPNPAPSQPITSPSPTGYSTAALELMGFKKGIKREIAACPSLKDQRYFDGFSRSVFIVDKSHECSDVLDPTYTPVSDPEQRELFEAKQTFMFSVFNAIS